jgi:hypothetical protein
MEKKIKNKRNRSTEVREEYITIIGITSTSKRRQTACT